MTSGITSKVRHHHADITEASGAERHEDRHRSLEEEPSPSRPIAGTPSNALILRSTYSSFANRRPSKSFSSDILFPALSRIGTSEAIITFRLVRRPWAALAGGNLPGDAGITAFDGNRWYLFCGLVTCGADARLNLLCRGRQLLAHVLSGHVYDLLISGTSASFQKLSSIITPSGS